MAAVTGLAISATIACWWLGSTRLALDDSSDASRAATDALMLTWMLRGIALAMFTLRSGALRGWRPGLAEAIALISPSWPVVILAWSACTVPWVHAALIELLLFLGAGALALTGQRLGAALKRSEFADALAMALGVALAAAIWLTRSFWAPPSS
jgi:hypothetical protein